MLRRRFFLLVLCVYTVSALAFAQTAGSKPETSQKNYFFGSRTVYELKLIPDIAILGTSLAFNISALLINNFSDSPSLSSLATDRSSINSFDRWSAMPYKKNVDTTGTVFEIISMIMPAVLFSSEREEWATIGIMYAESFTLAYGMKEFGKALVQRNRPYTYFDGTPNDSFSSGDFANSFFSGHTTLAFNGAVFASTVFAAYFPDSPWKIPVIAGSLSFATATGILRILSGNHFFSDVLTGAIIGSATGFFVPFLHRAGLPLGSSKKQKGLSFLVIPGEVHFTYNF